MADRTVLYAEYVVSRPWRMVALCLAAFLMLAAGGKHLYFDADYRVFFAEQNPQLAAFDEIERVYIKTDNILFTVKPNSGDVFQPKVLQMIQELTADSWKLPYAQRVDSVTNFQHSYAEQDDLTVADLVEGDPNRMGAAELSEIRDIALSEPILVGKLLNRNGNATGVNVLVNMPRTNEAVLQAGAAARELVASYRQRYPDIELRPSGFVFINNAFVENSMKDMMKLMPVMLLVLLLVMMILVRSWTATFATLLVIIFSALAAMGFAGWMGFPLTPVNASAPTIVLTLAIADSIHIIVSMIKAMHAGMAKRQAIVEAVRINMQPIFLTSITTVIGFLSLNFSESPPFWYLGNTTAFGIGAAFVFSIVLLPAVLSILPVKIKAVAHNGNAFMEKLSDMVIKFRHQLLIACVLVTALAATMIDRIIVDDHFVRYFDESISFRPDTEFMMKNLSGLHTIEYSIESIGPGKITEPEYLQHLDQFTEWLRSQPDIDHVFSVTDIFKRLNKNMHGDDDSWYRIPQQNDMAAQYLLLYEFSLPYGLDLNDRINIDKSATRVTVTTDDTTSIEMRDIKARTEQWLKDNTPEYMHAEGSGPALMFAFISERNINAMIDGNIFCLLLISAIMIFALRSLGTGLISLVPNLMPLVLGFGLWGFFIGKINMAVAFAFAVCLGIIVDDTVHFLSKYLRAKREGGMDARTAIKYTFNTVGSALLSTTIILVCGFMVLAQSSFQMNSFLGMLVALVIVSALLLDFFLLPPLLILIEDIKAALKSRKGEKQHES